MRLVVLLPTVIDIGCLQEKITSLLEVWEQVNSAVEELETCSYVYDDFRGILLRIQSVVSHTVLG
jgi:hypothetical protein